MEACRSATAIKYYAMEVCRNLTAYKNSAMTVAVTLRQYLSFMYQRHSKNNTRRKIYFYFKDI